MIKVVSLFRRKPGMSVADFQSYWRNEHAEIASRLPGLRRYVQSHTLLSGYSKRIPACDGVAELSFDDSSALRGLAGTPELAAALDDHGAFIDPQSYIEIVTEDVIIKDGPVPANGVKNIELVIKRPAMNAESFHRYWVEVHGPLGGSIPQIRRYVQSHTCMDAYRDAQVPRLDGVALTWFDDTAAMRAAAATQAYAETRADEDNFVTVPLDFVITTEHVVIA